MPKRTHVGGPYSRNKRRKTSSSFYGKPVRGYYRRSGYYGRFRRRGLINRRGYSTVALPEKKYFDSATVSGTVSNTGTILQTSINLVSQGNAPNQMIGRKIVIKRISARIICNLANAANATLSNLNGGEQMRLMMILDKQANGAAPAVTDILDGTNWMDFFKLENSKRFQLLKEWEFDFQQDIGHNDTATDVYFTGKQKMSAKWSKKCNYTIEFASNAGTRVITDVKSNNILWVGVTNISSTSITMDLKTRIRFYDD